MSLKSRREYLNSMHQRYRQANSRAEKSQIINEVTSMLDYNRKYAIQVLNGPLLPVAKPPAKRSKSLLYLEAMPAIQRVWEALDYPCAERLQPVLLPTAGLLASHGELTLTPEVREQLAQISRSTLARRLAKWRSPKPKFILANQKRLSRLRSEIPISHYDWQEDRPEPWRLTWSNTMAVLPSATSVILYLLLMQFLVIAAAGPCWVAARRVSFGS